jgi:hypothetical protein
MFTNLSEMQASLELTIRCFRFMAEPNPGFISHLKALEKEGFFQSLHIKMFKSEADNF